MEDVKMNQKQKEQIQNEINKRTVTNGMTLEHSYTQAGTIFMKVTSPTYNILNCQIKALEEITGFNLLSISCFGNKQINIKRRIGFYSSFNCCFICLLVYLCLFTYLRLFTLFTPIYSVYQPTFVQKFTTIESIPTILHHIFIYTIPRQVIPIYQIKTSVFQ